MWTLVSSPPICICIYNELWEILRFLWCSLLLFSVPCYSFPWEAAPLLARWLQRLSEGHNRIVPHWLYFLPSDICCTENPSLLQNRWQRTNSVQPVSAESKSGFTSAPVIFSFDWISPVHIWNPFSQCKPDVLFGLVSTLCKGLMHSSGHCQLFWTVWNTSRAAHGRNFSWSNCSDKACRIQGITDNVSHKIVQIALRQLTAQIILIKDFAEEKGVKCMCACACMCVYIGGGRQFCKEKNKHLMNLFLLFYIPVPYNKNHGFQR